MKELKPYSKEQGGPLMIEHIEYVKGRGNMKITIPCPTYPEGRYMGFVGSHMDVVPANPEEWEVDPFTLTIKDDKLYGRGTTDCLGHIGLITRMIAQICESKIKLKRNVIVVFIAAEEGGELGVGVDKLVECGKVDEQRGFTCASTMKPTQIECTKGSINQIPPQCTAHGDIRLSPFYDIAEAKEAVTRYVKEINAEIDKLPCRG